MNPGSLKEVFRFARRSVLPAFAPSVVYAVILGAYEATAAVVGVRAADRIWSIVAPVVLIPLVVLIQWLVVRAFVRALHSTRWPTTVGVLDWFAIKPGARGAMLSVRYRYRVGGVEYTSNQYRFGEGVGIFEGCPYPSGTPVDHWRIGTLLVVHHHPRQPRVATIETGVSSSMVAGVAIWTTIVVLSAVGWGAHLLGR